MMKEQTIDGRRLIDIPSYRDRLMQVHGKVMASQAHSLRLLSSRINPGQNVKLGGMIQKLVGTELRHELEGLAIDVLGEIGTLYEDSPYLKEDGSTCAIIQIVFNRVLEQHIYIYMYIYASGCTCTCVFFA